MYHSPIQLDVFPTDVQTRVSVTCCALDMFSEAFHTSERPETENAPA